MENTGVTDMTRGVYRRIYGGYITGQRINRLSLAAEAWFWRLTVTVDDFGNGRAEPNHCRAVTAGNRSVTPKQIAGWIDEMQKAGLIDTYAVKGEYFLHIIDFEVNQPAGRNGKRFKRHPRPDESEESSGATRAIQVNPGESKKKSNSQKPQQNSKTESSGAFGSIQESSGAFGAITTTIPKIITSTNKEEEGDRQSKYSTDEWERYVACHPRITNPEKFLNSTVTGKHDRNMRLWLEQTNGTNKPGRESAAERNVRNFKRNIDYLNSLPEEGGSGDSDSAPGLLTTNTRR